MTTSNQGGAHDQHAKAGEQSHKTAATPQGSSNEKATRGGAQDQHGKPADHGHKTTGSSDSDVRESSTRAGAPQHVKAGEQNHKNR